VQFQYFRPQSKIWQLVSSYYNVTVPDDISDIMRAEIANIRFVIRGRVATDINGVEEEYGPGATLLCGPTYKWSNVRFAPGTQVFGAAITPMGWARLFDVGADQLANRLVPLEAFVPEPGLPHIQDIFHASDEEHRVEAADKLFAAMVDPARRIDEDFLDQVTAWITSPDPNELNVLISEMRLSPRQIERLCKKYFGSAPKLLHRKFRALHSANRLTWQELTDWQDIATTAYSDQSHFIREFKQFNGRTPSEFIKGAHILVRMTLEQRLQIDHESPFSLIG
jgi:AraC-like DNA-binding protein